MDEFLKKTKCDRCGNPLGTRTMSMFNTDVICQACKDAERKRPDYDKAVKADHDAISKGNLNFPGIGYTPLPKTNQSQNA